MVVLRCATFKNDCAEFLGSADRKLLNMQARTFVANKTSIHRLRGFLRKYATAGDILFSCSRKDLEQHLRLDTTVVLHCQFRDGSCGHSDMILSTALALIDISFETLCKFVYDQLSPNRRFRACQIKMLGRKYTK